MLVNGAISGWVMMISIFAVQLGPTALHSSETTHQATAGDTVAVISIRQTSEMLPKRGDAQLILTTFRITRLQIFWRHTLAFTGSLPANYDLIPSLEFPDLVQVIALARGSRPQVLIRTFTGGAHCCFGAVVLDYDAGKHTYSAHTHDFGNDGFKLQTFGHDTSPRFRTGDDRFSDLFTSNAQSRTPLLILAFRSGEFVDVTNCYLGLVEEDARGHWLKALRELRSPEGEPEGAFAAWVADEYRLGKGAEALKRVRGISGIKPSFVSGLTQFLRKAGYTGIISPRCESQ
jgi:hypothetical protein